jgi:hypothetical protein
MFFATIELAYDEKSPFLDAADKQLGQNSVGGRSRGRRRQLAAQAEGQGQ